MTIRHHKRQARLRAAASGNSLQTELNAIARENGHAVWGDFQAALKATSPAKVDNNLEKVNFMRPSDEEIEVEALVDAFEAARESGGHLVVLRATPELEERALSLLLGEGSVPHAHRLAMARPVDALTSTNMAKAQAAGNTLIAGSGNMPRDTSHGNFIAHAPDQPLRNGQGLVSERDQQVMHATTAVKYILPQNDVETIRPIQGAVGATTIRRSAKLGKDHSVPSTRFRSVDQDGMAIELDWNTPMDQRDADWKRIPFMPAFNALGPKFLPTDPDALERHLDRVVHILLPDDGRGDDYFETKGRQTMIGFLLVEIGRAARDGRAPSIPALIDWINEGLRDAADENDPKREAASRTGGSHAGDTLSDWLKSLVVECRDNGYHQRAAVEIVPLVSTAPNERSGILGTMDKGFLPFKNRHVRERTS